MKKKIKFKYKVGDLVMYDYEEELAAYDKDDAYGLMIVVQTIVEERELRFLSPLVNSNLQDREKRSFYDKFFGDYRCYSFKDKAFYHFEENEIIPMRKIEK